MKIEATQYTREDGVTLIRILKGVATPDGWVIRKIQGPAWFYNAASKQWDISTAMSFEVTRYAIPFEQAYALLETVER